MAKKDTLSSTERLLRVIRNGDEGDGHREQGEKEPGRPGGGGSPVQPQRKPRRLLKRKSGVGIAIGHDAVRVVAATPEGASWRVSQFWKLPLKVAHDSPEFPSHLKKLLDESLGSSRGDLWTFLPSPQVEVIHLRIPRGSKKDISTTVLWTLKRDKGLDEKERNFDFLVEGEVVEKGIPKLAVVAVTFPARLEVETKALFSRIGYPLKGLTAPPFALQNLFSSSWLQHGGQAVSVLDILDKGSRIDIFHNENLTLSRDIKTGIGSIVDSFVSEYREYKARTPVDAEGEQQPQDAEMLLTATQSKQMLLWALGYEGGQGKPGALRDISAEALFEMALPALQRLARQIERTFTYNAQTLGRENVGSMLLAGELGACPRLREYLSEQLGMKVDALDIFSSGGTGLTRSAAPDDPKEKVLFSPVVGLAMSHSDSTPNLLHTYKEKVSQQRAVTVQRLTLLATFACALILGGIFLWQTQEAATRQQELSSVQQELAGYQPQVDEAMLAKLAAEVKNGQQRLKKYSKRYAGLAALTEIIQLTPDRVKLHKVTTDLNEKATGGNNRWGSMIIEGIVTGEEVDFETVLAGYLVRLRGSPLLADPTVHNRSVKVYSDAGEVLHFIVYLNVI